MKYKIGDYLVAHQENGTFLWKITNINDEGFITAWNVEGGYQESAVKRTEIADSVRHASTLEVVMYE